MKGFVKCYRSIKDDQWNKDYPTMDKLDGVCLIRTANNRFYTFANHRLYWEWQLAAKNEYRTNHEVIHGNRPQRLKFDLDGEVTKLEPLLSMPSRYHAQNVNEFWNNLVDDVILAIIECAHNVWGIELDFDKHFILCESNGHGDVIKYSTHIIIRGYHVINNQEAIKFTEIVKQHVEAGKRQCIDNVNRSIQSFRILGCHKIEDSDRVKDIVHPVGGVDALETFITWIEPNNVVLGLIPAIPTKSKPFQSETLMDGIQDRIVDLIKSKGYLDYFRIGSINGQFVNFIREHPSYCQICDREHEHDNTQYIRIATQSNGDINLYAGCIKVKGKSDFIGKVFNPNNPMGADENDCMIDGIDRFIHSKIEAIRKHNPDDYYAKSQFHHGPVDQTLIYNSKTMQDYPICPTLIVHANMGLGKTKKLREFLDTNYPLDSPEPKKIIYLSFRRSFSDHIKHGFPEFTLYSDVIGMISESRVIIQLESLHRLVVIPDEIIDLVILDECESLWAQFQSGLYDQFGICLSTFRYLMSASKMVLCMDAIITDRTFNLLKYLRPGFSHSYRYHHNLHRLNGDKTWLFTADLTKWLGILRGYVVRDKRIVIPVSSIDEAETLNLWLTTEFPTKHIKMYSSLTLASIKQSHFSQVDVYWKDVDILIYTPTLTAGVSFELEWFDYIFGYFTNVSCNVQTSLQMIGRIRSVKEGRYFIYFNNIPGNTNPETIEDIHKWVMDKHLQLRLKLDDIGLIPEYSLNGILTYQKSAYYNIWLQNTVINNVSRNRFVECFMEYVHMTGAKIDILDDKGYRDVTGVDLLMVDGKYSEPAMEVRNLHDSYKDDCKYEKYKGIAEAPEIDEIGVLAINERIKNMDDVHIQERYQVNKYYLRRIYQHNGCMDAKFVDLYDTPGAKRAWKYLNEVYPYPSEKFKTTLAKLRKVQTLQHNSYIASGMDTDMEFDLRHSYTCIYHQMVSELLKLYGWKDILDTTYLSKGLILDNLNTNTRALAKMYVNVRSVVALPKYQYPRGVFGYNELTLFIKLIKAVLVYFYDMYPKLLGDKYQLRFRSLFCLTINKTVKLAYVPTAKMIPDPE